MRGKKNTYLIDGNELTIQQISELFGISYTAVYNRSKDSIIRSATSIVLNIRINQLLLGSFYYLHFLQNL